MPYRFSDLVAFSNGQTRADLDRQLDHHLVSDPAGSYLIDPVHPGDRAGDLLDLVDRLRFDSIHDTRQHLLACLPGDVQDGRADYEAHERVGPGKSPKDPEDADERPDRGQRIGAGVLAISHQRRAADRLPDPDLIHGNQLIANSPDQAAAIPSPR